MIFGYVRVSSADQNVGRQLDKMKQLNIDDRNLFIEHASGKDFNRPQYALLKRMLRAGDILYLDALDRLGRTYDGIIREWKDITRTIGADIVVLDTSLFDSRQFKQMNEIGKLLEDQFLSMLSYVAEQERLKTIKRQAEGIRHAKNHGVRFGRPKIQITKQFIAVHEQWRKKLITARDAMQLLHLKPNTFYRLVREHETNFPLPLHSTPPKPAPTVAQS